MSTQSQAYVIDRVNPADLPQHPRFRVIEGGHGGNASLSGAAARTQRPKADGHVYSLRTRVTLVAMTIVACLMLSFAWTLTDRLVALGVRDSFAQASHETITVRTGDSLWSIADAHPVAGTTTAEVVRHIRECNDLADTCLYPGMELSVPQASRA